MSIPDKIKVKVAEYAAKDLSRKAERGDFGGFLQRAYVATKGYKASLGLALFLIIQAIGTFTPPETDSYIRYLSLAAGVLVAIGLIDKAYRNQPIWEPWFLEALASASAWISAGSAVVLALAQSGLVNLIFPGDLALLDQITLYATALTTATAFLNRLAAANAAPPQKVDHHEQS